MAGTATTIAAAPAGSRALDRAGLVIPRVAAGSVPWLTVEQMREVDRLMVEEVGVSLVQMMENAGRSLAELAVRQFEPARVSVLAGRGNNGGGGLAAARHLANRGVSVTVTLAAPTGQFAGVPAAQLRALTAMEVPINDHPVPADLVLDALVGYGLSGALHGRAADLAQWATSQGAPILALDAPTGLDITTGQPSEAAARATATMTLAAPKLGLRHSDLVGQLYLADISVPVVVYRRMGLPAPTVFASHPVVRLVNPDDTPARP